jgi:hypothetical protein
MQIGRFSIKALGHRIQGGLTKEQDPVPEAIIRGSIIDPTV